MADIYVADSGFKTTWALTQDGSAYVLTGATAAIVFTKPDGTTLAKTGVVETPATGGIVSYTWAVGDIDQAGTWKVTITTTKGSEILHGVDTFIVGAT